MSREQARFRERQKAKQADTERRMAGLEAELRRLQVPARSSTCREPWTKPWLRLLPEFVKNESRPGPLWLQCMRCSGMGIKTSQVYLCKPSTR